MTQALPEHVLEVLRKKAEADPRYAMYLPQTECNVKSQRLNVELLAGQAGRPRFNASWIRYKGRLLLAYRTGWAGSMVRLSVMKPDMTPETNITLARLRRSPRASYGREDPRLFIYRGELYVSFTGVEQTSGGLVTNVCYAKIRDDLTVHRVFAPKYEQRAYWEKNWVFFEGDDGNLYCVYSISPHRVLRIDGDRVTAVHETVHDLPWSGGHQRGGCSPVRVGGSYVHWFHGAWDLGEEWPTRRYTVGAYRFDPAPPFTVRSMTPDPVLIANPDTRPKDQYCEVIFPGGAMLEDQKWKLVAGIHDRWIETFELPPYAHLGVPKSALTAPAKRPLPCIGLGPIIRSAGCACRRKDERTCLKGHGTVTQAVTCETCGDYEADES